ncbi:MAG: putative PHD type zinc finger protein with BAH domain-containing protein [Cirrosporium novae-zelandiae]|nr:MAG: putative PHD type zinc finger protein with BAH domain-containing protein [Cirrosporium novae-zelandiae]
MEVDNPSSMGSSTASSFPEANSDQRTSRPKTSVCQTPIEIINFESPSEPQQLESHPMTTSLSSSSTSSTKDATSASPYGTRSRNRTGGPRPNYAEDVSLEMEAESSNNFKVDALRRPSPTSTLSAEVSRPQSVEPERAPNPPSNGRRHNTTTNNGDHPLKSSVTASANGKDAIPGMTTFSAKPNNQSATAASKKRKAPGNPSHNGGPVPGATQTLKAAATGPSTRDSGLPLSNMMTFEGCGNRLKNGKLKADDGTVLAINDHVYLICEPPGEPYYLGRIMEFIHAHNDHAQPIDSVRVNWYYRPRDIQLTKTDTRLVYATMHSDVCPLSSLRGKCRIMHKSDIPSIDEYRKSRDCFWYERMFDRYIHRHYEVIPTSQVINVPENVKQVLRARWKFVVVEVGHGKDLTSAAKTCKRCQTFCSKNDSVDCAVCHNTYHMNCVSPPLLRKPQRGFAWSCGPCSRAQERKLEARNTPRLGDAPADDEDEIMEEEEEDANAPGDSTGRSTPATKFEPGPATAEQIEQTKQWPYRYLGMHCRVEDALDYDDRIYPRASSRLGPRHQANVQVWHGHPVEYVKPAESKRKYMKNNKKDSKLSKEVLAAIEADKLAKEKRPKWVMDEPHGYVRRGEDHPNDSPECTARAIFKMPEVGEPSSRGGDDSDTDKPKMDFETREKLVDDYMKRVRELSGAVGVTDFNTNFLTKAIELLYKNNYNVEESLEQVAVLHKRKDLREPELNKEEIKRFEEGVKLYGSELWPIAKHVRTVKHADIVRFYYMWKKTERGREIWGNHEGRRKNKKMENSSKLVDDVADEQDDSAFDNRKAVEKKRGFRCKFCSTKKSKCWRRAPGTVPGTTVPDNSKSGKEKGGQALVALCLRCAELWRKYGVQWEDMDEVAKKVAAGGGRAWKRKIDEELLKELVLVNESNQVTQSAENAPTVASTPAPPLHPQEPPKKKIKTNTDKDTPLAATNNGHTETNHKRKLAEKPVEPPPMPIEEPKFKQLPCAICEQTEPADDQLLCCRDCRLTVHRNCYGVSEGRNGAKWSCDMCVNDRTPQVSNNYNCVLCPVQRTHYELLEPTKVSHKKKTDRERDKERKEKERAAEFAKQYKQEKLSRGQPTEPREPLKRTAHNNWMHVVCAIWTPEIKFTQAKSLEPAEGFGTIPPARFQEVCKICKTSQGACISCQQCGAPVHVSCAQRAEYVLGFDITPVKSSRRDAINTITLGSETGSATAAVWCKEHSLKTIVHPMHEISGDSNLNALQVYAQAFKQADLLNLGTVRKAALINQIIRPPKQSISSDRRASTSNGTHLTRSQRTSPSSILVKSEEVKDDSQEPETARKQCCTCFATFTPKWWSMDQKGKLAITSGLQHTNQQPSPSTPTMASPLVNGDKIPIRSTPLSMDAQRSSASDAQPEVQCHKCHVNKVKKPITPLENGEGHPGSKSGSLAPTIIPLDQPLPPSLYEFPVYMQPRGGVPWRKMTAPVRTSEELHATSNQSQPLHAAPAPPPPDSIVNGYSQSYPNAPTTMPPSTGPVHRESYLSPAPLPHLNSYDRNPHANSHPALPHLVNGAPPPYYSSQPPPPPSITMSHSPPNARYPVAPPPHTEAPPGNSLPRVHSQPHHSPPLLSGMPTQLPPANSLPQAPPMENSPLQAYRQPLLHGPREFPPKGGREGNRPMTPAERIGSVIETPRVGSETRNVIGASASPSLRNLLS